MKKLFTISVTITCLAVLALPALAGDGGPPPICPPGTDCSVRLPSGSTNDRPLCCSLQPPPSGDRTFGDINVQDKSLAQFWLVSPAAPRVTTSATSNPKPQESSLVKNLEIVPSSTQ
jgi:hypothetical protein